MSDFITTVRDYKITPEFRVTELSPLPKKSPKWKVYFYSFIWLLGINKPSIIKPYILWSLRDVLEEEGRVSGIICNWAVEKPW